MAEKLYTRSEVESILAEGIAQTLSLCGYDGGPELEEDTGESYDSYVARLSTELIGVK